MWARNFAIVTRHLAQIAHRTYLSYYIMEHYSLLITSIFQRSHLFWTVFRTSSETFPTWQPSTHTQRCYGLTETWFISLIFYHLSWLALVHSEVCQVQWETRSYENSARAEFLLGNELKNQCLFSMCAWLNRLTLLTNKVVNSVSHHWMKIWMKKCLYIVSTTW